MIGTDDEIERIKREKMIKIMTEKSTDSPEAPIHIETVEQFKEYLEKNTSTPILIDFWAPWCGPCRMLTPIYEKLAEQFKGKVIFLKLNTEELGSVAQYFGVSSIPLVVLIHENEVKANWLGLRPIEFYQRELKAILNKINE
ncbi:MAG: thioredoxin family protein [Candidatus Hodarchaeota archaeon]